MPVTRPRLRRARGPIRSFSIESFTAKEAAKMMATTPTQVVHRAPMRCSRLRGVARMATAGAGSGTDAGADASTTASRTADSVVPQAGAGSTGWAKGVVAGATGSRTGETSGDGDGAAPGAASAV